MVDEVIGVGWRQRVVLNVYDGASVYVMLKSSTHLCNPISSSCEPMATGLWPPSSEGIERKEEGEQSSEDESKQDDVGGVEGRRSDRRKR